jgi:hypothetical protein
MAIISRFWFDPTEDDLRMSCVIQCTGFKTYKKKAFRLQQWVCVMPFLVVVPHHLRLMVVKNIKRMLGALPLIHSLVAQCDQ